MKDRLGRPIWPFGLSTSVPRSGRLDRAPRHTGWPGEGSPGNLQVPGRHPVAERLEPPAHIAGRQLPERPGADVLQQRPKRLAVDGSRSVATGPAARLEPVIHHLLDRVRGRRMQPAVKLSVGRLELVPDLGLGLTGDPCAGSACRRTEADRDRPDETVLRRVEVDRVLAMAATARLPTRCASADGLRIGVGRSRFTSSVTGLRRLWSCWPRAGASACTRVLVAMVPPGPVVVARCGDGWLGRAVVRGMAAGWPGPDGWGSRAGRSGRSC